METGKSRLYLPEDRGGRGGEGGGKKTCNWLSTADEGRWVQIRLASVAAVIFIPSYSRYNENCVWKQCHLQRQSGKKLWSGPVQLHGSQGTVSRMWCLDNYKRLGPLCFWGRASLCYSVRRSVIFFFFYKVNKNFSFFNQLHPLLLCVQQSATYECLPGETGWKCVSVPIYKPLAFRLDQTWAYPHLKTVPQLRSSGWLCDNLCDN